jgi:uncharacterized protein YdeI (YjbR/CyaY-like superfamily)
MATKLTTLEIGSRQQWRKWLRKHHASSPGVWLTFHKNNPGVRSIPYEDSVREALCFGWIDSLVKRIDDQQYVRKFTPRRPTSKWSDINRKRWLDLKAAELLAKAGLKAAPTDNRYNSRREILDLPNFIVRALKANPKAWSFLQELAPSYRRQFVEWIHAAKQPRTRENRISESIALLAAGKKLGLK